MVPVLWPCCHDGGQALNICRAPLSVSPLPGYVWSPKMNMTTTVFLKVLTIYWEAMTEMQMNPIQAIPKPVL